MGHQHHHGHVGKTAPDTRQEVEDKDGDKPRAVADEDHAGGEKNQPDRDRTSPSPPVHEERGHGDRGKVPGEIPGPDEAHLVVAEAQGFSHRGEQHAVGEPRQPQAGEDGKSSGEDDDPAIVCFWWFHEIVIRGSPSGTESEILL